MINGLFLKRLKSIWILSKRVLSLKGWGLLYFKAVINRRSSYIIFFRTEGDKAYHIYSKTSITSEEIEVREVKWLVEGQTLSECWSEPWSESSLLQPVLFGDPVVHWRMWVKDVVRHPCALHGSLNGCWENHVTHCLHHVRTAFFLVWLPDHCWNSKKCLSF